MQSIHYKIVTSIKTIQKEEWGAIFGDLPEGYRFFKTLEESGLEEFSFCYVLLYRSGELAAIAPLFMADFYVDSILEERVGRTIRLVRRAIPRFMVLRTLFCGSPFGEQGVLGIRRDEPEPQAVMGVLAGALDALCRERNASLVVFKDFPEADTGLLEPLASQGFFKAESFPSVVVELPFHSMDDYFKSLGQATRKSLRRTLKKSHARAEIMVRVLDGVADCIDEVYRLYEQTYNAGATKFEHLTRDFFIRVAENFGSDCKYFLYYVNGRLAAFNLCLVHRDLLIDKFIGFDYEVSREYGLYFVSWCHNVEWCLRNGIRRYQVGQTDYGPKLQLGGRCLPLQAYVRHTSRVVNGMLRLLSRYLNV